MLMISKPFDFDTVEDQQFLWEETLFDAGQDEEEQPIQNDARYSSSG